jgi:hypothetical protein
MASDSNSSASDLESLRKDMDALKRDFTKLMTDVRSATTERAERLYGNIRDNGPDAVRDRVRERPIASLAMAFLAGAILATILRR